MIEKNVAKSISAIKQYISKSEQSTGRHRAHILIHANEKDHGPGTQIVYASVEWDFGKVIIENLDSLYVCCSNTFTTKDSRFYYVAGTLCINTEGSLGGKISISIT